MNLKDALAIVIDLANENALDPNKCDADLVDTATCQQQAIQTIADQLKILRGDPQPIPLNPEDPLAPPFSTTGKISIPMHAICWPPAYMTIQDSHGKTVLMVPAIINRTDPDKPFADKDKTLALTNTFIMLLNRGVRFAEFTDDLIKNTQELNGHPSSSFP